MSITRLRYLFQQFITRAGTPAETDEFLAMLRQTSFDEEIQALLDEYWNGSGPVISLSEEKAERIFNSIVAGAEAGELVQIQKTKSFPWMRIAASLLIICGLGYSLYKFRFTPKIEKQNLVAAVKKNKPLRRFVKLPDGSSVILNENSKIEYGSKFRSGGRREVYLTGEAYFDIKHNKTRPFIVHTGELRITVLGTAFNVNANPENETVTVTVTRGKVGVGDRERTYGIILPNQQIVYNKIHNEHITKQVKATQVIEWKNEDLYFDDVSMEDIVDQLQERFHVNVEFSNDAIRNCRFSATFLKSQNLEQILNVIAEFNQMTYKFQNPAKTIVELSGEGCK